MVGTGIVEITLVSDSGMSNKVTLYDYAYVNFSPFNILRPVLIIQNLKASGYKTKIFSHDDEIYQFNYKLPGKSTKFQQLTIPISQYGLFNFQTKSGFSSFSRQLTSMTPPTPPSPDHLL